MQTSLFFLEIYVLESLCFSSFLVQSGVRERTEQWTRRRTEGGTCGEEDEG